MKIKNTAVLKLTALLPMLVVATSAYAHSGSSSNIAWEVCADKPRSMSCEYKGFHGERYIGTCQSMSDSMICVRNQPIIPAEEDTSDHAKEAPISEPKKVEETN